MRFLIFPDHMTFPWEQVFRPVFSRMQTSNLLPRHDTSGTARMDCRETVRPPVNHRCPGRFYSAVRPGSPRRVVCGLDFFIASSRPHWRPIAWPLEAAGSRCSWASWRGCRSLGSAKVHKEGRLRLTVTGHWEGPWKRHDFYLPGSSVRDRS